MANLLDDGGMHGGRWLFGGKSCCPCLSQANRPAVLIWNLAFILSVGVITAQAQGTVVFPTNAVPPPANDLFTNAFELTGNIVSVTGSNNSATTEIGEPHHQNEATGKSVWWRWTAGESDVVEVALTSISYVVVGWPEGRSTFEMANNFAVAVYTGSQLDALRAQILEPVVPVGGLNDPRRFRFRAVAGETYSIAVASLTNSGGPASLLGSAPFTLHLTAGPLELVKPSRSPLVLGQPVRFEFAAVAGAPKVKSLEAFVNGNSLGTTKTPLRFLYTPDGNASNLMVWAEGTNRFGQRTRTLPLQFPVVPANSRFSSALEIVGSKGAFTSAPASLPATAPVWWHWVPKGDGLTTIRLNSSESRLIVYRGKKLAKLRQILSLQTGQLLIPFLPISTSGNFEPVAGKDYYVAVQGNASVSWDLSQKALELSPVQPSNPCGDQLSVLALAPAEAARTKMSPLIELSVAGGASSVHSPSGIARMVWTLRAPAGHIYVIEAQTPGETWTPLLVLTNEVGTVTFTDPRPSLPSASFYRARFLE